MNETKLGFFSRFFYSIASFEKYRLFLRQSTGKAATYLFLVSLVFSLIVYIPGTIEFNNIIDDLTINFNKMVPDFKLENGKLEVDGKMPIILSSENYAIIIDTSPGADERILDEYDKAVLITSDKFIRKEYAEKTTIELRVFQGPTTITRDRVRQALPSLKLFGVIILILSVLFNILGKFISAFFISFIGMIINTIKNTGLSYRSIFKLSIYSMTPSLLVCTILDLIPANIPLKWILFYIIACIYIYCAISTIRKEIDMFMGNGNFY